MDRKPTETNGARTAALLGKQAAPPAEKPAPRRVAAAAPPPAPAPAPKIYTVEAIRAAKRSEEVVR
jgi:hypothetical protein